MNPLIMLALVAAAEAVVWIWRMRTAVGSSRWRAALATVGVCATRCLWLGAGVQAAMEGSLILGSAVYIGVAAAATVLVHGGER